jgi:transcriptional regulator with XRE-family HTH domain
VLSDTVGERVSIWRKRRGWNRERLAKECSRLGMPELTHAAITNIESGRRDKNGVRRRSVTVDEMTVLAYALDIPPMILMSPYPEGRSFEIYPGRTIPSYMGFFWLAGAPGPSHPRQYIAEFDDKEFDIDNWLEAADPVRVLLFYNLSIWIRMGGGDELLDALEAVDKATQEQELTLAKSRRDEAIRRVEGYDYAIVEWLQEMREKGYPEPILPYELHYLSDKTPEDYQRRPQDIFETKHFEEYTSAVLDGLKHATEIWEEEEKK